MQVDSCHNLAPLCDLHKLLDMYIIYIDVSLCNKFKKCRLEFLKLSFKIASAYMLPHNRNQRRL